jgi:hypothetical protein
MLPAPQHAPPAYNWLPGNIHDLNMIRKVVPRCIEITTLVYPIAVDISSLQKCDLIHHFPDRHGWASFAMPFCQFAGFEIPMPFLLPKEELDFCRCNKYRPRVSKSSIDPFSAKTNANRRGFCTATARRWRENGRSGQSSIQDGIHAHNQVLKMANWGDQDPCTGHAALN